MKIKISEYITIEQKYNMFEINSNTSLEPLNDPTWIDSKLFGYNPTIIHIKNKPYDVIPLHLLARSKSTDGYYRFIYIQINMLTNEYYIGKVNRKSWKELMRYQGSGLLFTNKYSKHKDEFVRYYIASCNSQKETEIIEAKIVDEILLQDNKCLNLVKGGGGVSNMPLTQERKEKQSLYMKSHPENYKEMIKVAKAFYCSGSTIQLEQRNNKIKSTMSSNKYREMSRERILRWKEEHPDEYSKSRENNRLSQQSEATKLKRNESLKKWRENNPEEYLQQQNKLIESRTSIAANAKRANSLKLYYDNNPQAKERLINAGNVARIKQQKPVNMIDLDTNIILHTFDSQHDAARWLVENGYAKNINCVSSINAVCLKRPCKSGYGYRKKAYGFGWEYANKSL